jgi:hypothetical protein
MSMTENLGSMPADGALMAQRLHMSELLGLDQPVSEAVLLAALEDSAYAHNLLVCRSNQRMLSHLLSHPPTQAAPQVLEPAEPEPAGPSNLELVGKAAGAFVTWAKAGLPSLAPEDLRRRQDACLACPSIADVPADRLLHRVARSRGPLGDKICHRCGCNLGRKTAIATESCPAPHPLEPGMTRWGEAAIG